MSKNKNTWVKKRHSVIFAILRAIVAPIIRLIYGYKMKKYKLEKNQGYFIISNLTEAGTEYLYVLYTAAGAILGHNFPFYMQFKGGKGIASTFGLILSFHPWFIPMGFIVFLGIFMTTHYVSLGSLLIYAGFVIQMIIMGQTGNLGEINQNVLNEMYLIAFLLMAMAYWKHRENIKRLLTGTERKTYLFKKNKSE